MDEVSIKKKKVNLQRISLRITQLSTSLSSVNSSFLCLPRKWRGIGSVFERIHRSTVLQRSPQTCTLVPSWRTHIGLDRTHLRNWACSLDMSTGLLTQVNVLLGCGVATIQCHWTTSLGIFSASCRTFLFRSQLQRNSTKSARQQS